MWIPFYSQHEGLLKNLEQIIMLIIEKEYQNENIDYNLETIHKYLSEIKCLDIMNH
jgi:hypothetical protein